MEFKGGRPIDLPVDKQEVSHQAQQGRHSGSNCQVALKVVLETHKEEAACHSGVVRVEGGLLSLSPDT